MRYDARGFSLLPKQPVSSLLSGRFASRLRGRGLLFEELRGYRPGDDIRTIDWKATARLRKTQIRVYTEERERPVMLLVDQRTNMLFGSARTTKATAAVELASLAAWRALDAGDRVGAVIFGDHDVAEIRAQRSQSNVLKILHQLVEHNKAIDIASLTEAETSLNKPLSRMINLAKHDNLIVLITDFFGANNETRQIVTRLAAKNDVLACLVYDPLGISFSGPSQLGVTDGRQNATVNPNATFATNFKDAFMKRSKEIREVLTALRIPILPICTHEPVVDQVKYALGVQK